MIVAIEIILELFIAYKLLTEEDYGKLFYYYIAGTILLYPYFRFIPWCIPNIFLSAVATVRLIKDGTFSSCWEAFPEKKMMLAFLAFVFIQPIMSGRFGYSESILAGLQDFIGHIYQLFIGFCLAPTYDELKKHKNILYTTIGILSVVGITSYVMKYNFVAFGIDDTNVWIEGAGGRAFRSVATQVSPAIYGMICAALAIFILQIEENKSTTYLMLTLLLANIICCSTRSPLMELIVAISAFYILKGARQFVKYLFVAAIVLFVGLDILSTAIPEVHDLVGGITDIFTTGGENTKGSNVEMRQLQLAASYAYFLQNPIWGNGVLFIGSITSKTGQYHHLYNTDLLGSEGYIYYLLIEYGIIYIILIITLTIKLIRYFLEYRKKDNELGSLSLAIFSVLILHLFFTRPENAWDVIFPILGIMLYYSCYQEDTDEDDASIEEYDEYADTEIESNNYHF